MIYFKKCIVLVVLLLLILTLNPTFLLAQDNYGIPFEKIKNPTELQDIIDTFDRLKYNFIAFKEGEKAQELIVEFQYQGKEEVKGVQADKLFVESSIKSPGINTSKPSQMIFWLDDDELVKMLQEGQEIPIAMADTIKEKILQAVFFPFYHFKELNLKEIASDSKVTNSQEMIGEKEFDIIEIEGNNLVEYGLKSGTMKLADFDKFIMMVSFDYITLEEAEAEFEKGEFEMIEIELR